MDLIVLESNNWGKHRPKFIVVEYFLEGRELPILSYLNSIGYEVCASTIANKILKDIYV